MKGSLKKFCYVFLFNITVFNTCYGWNNCLNNYNSWYLKMTEGLSSRNDEPHGNGTKKFKLGEGIGLSLGYNFRSLGKLEGEIIARENAVKVVTDTILGDPISTTEQTLDFMVNAYLSPFCWCNFTPFLGAGYGYARTQYGIHENLANPPSFSHQYHTTYHSAYQYMGGINYALAENVTLGLEYRYFKIPSLTYLNIHSRYISNDVLLNLTYLFNSPNCCRSIFNNIATVYLALEGGITGRENEPYSTGTKSFQNGPALGIALGYDHCDYTRIEAEFLFRQNTVDFILLAPGNRDRPTGDEMIYAYMGNIYFTPLTHYRLMPYLGAGIGYATMTYPIHIFLAANPPAYAHPRLSTSSVAYQGMVGFTYKLANNFQLGIEYRNFRVNDIFYKQIDGSLIHSHIRAHTGLLRLTYLFAC